MIPYEIEFYEKAATILLTVKEYDTAEMILRQSLDYKESYFAVKWLGQIALMKKNYRKAIYYLEKGRVIKSNDTQLLFNLGRAYYYSGQKELANEILCILKGIGPNSKYTKILREMF